MNKRWMKLPLRHLRQDVPHAGPSEPHNAADLRVAVALAAQLPDTTIPILLGLRNEPLPGAHRLETISHTSILGPQTGHRPANTPGLAKKPGGKPRGSETASYRPVGWPGPNFDDLFGSVDQSGASPSTSLHSELRGAGPIPQPDRVRKISHHQHGGVNTKHQPSEKPGTGQTRASVTSSARR